MGKTRTNDPPGVAEAPPLAYAGIWIALCEAVHTFWMKMPIDVIFLSRNHTVKKIVPRLKPWRIAACLTAASVLELQPDAAERAGLRVGGRLRFEPAA